MSKIFQGLQSVIITGALEALNSQRNIITDYKNKAMTAAKAEKAGKKLAETPIDSGLINTKGEPMMQPNTEAQVAYADLKKKSVKAQYEYENIAKKYPKASGYVYDKSTESSYEDKE